MEVDSLELKIESSADGAAAKVDTLTSALANLKKTARVTKGLRDVADLLERINKFSGANLNINLDAGKAKEFSDAMKSVTKESRKSEGALKDVNKQTKIFGTSASSANLRSLLKDVYGFARRAYGKIKSLVDAGTDYVETINLAQVAMKDYFAEAEAYANRVNDKLGVDPAAWLKTQATFMAMGTGFGFAEDKAYQLSKALTELSYDISSLYNEDIETATQRLQSAFAGEIEPIRRLGISISQATLEEFALSKGITESVSAMTEQEKSLLRTLKIIEDSKKIGAVGDLARTIEQPANALRVLDQQFTQLKRTVGTTFIPLLINVIPYLQAATELLTDMVSGIATLVGFEMPEWDADSWSGLENGADGVTGSIEEATEAAKELKRQTAGFDELNVLSANDGSGISADGGTSSWINDLEIPSLWDDTVLDQIADKTKEIKENIGPVVDGVMAFSAALLTLKFASGFIADAKAFNNIFGEGKYKQMIGASLLISGIVMGVDTGKLIVEGEDVTLESIGTAAASALGGYFIGSAVGGPVGGAIGAVSGILLGAAVTFTSFVIAFDEEARKTGLENFKATEAGQLVEDAMAVINDAATTAELKLVISNITGEISADDAGKLALAQQLIDDIFGLVDKDNLNEGEIGLVSQWVSAFNDLNVIPLKLEFDELTGGINASKDAIEALIKKQHEQMMLTAAQDALTKAYEAGEEARLNFDSKLNAQNELIKTYEAEAQKLKDMQAAWDAKSTFGGVGAIVGEWLGLGDFGYSDLLAQKAVVENLQDDYDKAKTAVADAALVYAEAAYKIEDLTKYYDELVLTINGIDLSQGDTAFTELAESASKFTTTMESAVAALPTYVTEINSELSKINNSIPLPIGGSGTYGGSGGGGGFRITIDAHADGGFPTMGDLFIANEAGPELVGTLGGHTAVANNDQIVAGIANGVASANAAQNALLREQNNILFAILQKTGIVTLDGKMLDHSIEQYKNNRGATILSGGVR